MLDIESGAEGADNRSLNEILRDLLNAIQDLIRTEILLARTEAGQQVRLLKSAAVFMAAAALFGLLGAASLIVTCISVLALVMPLWLATLLIGIGLSLVSGGAFIVGRMKLEESAPFLLRTHEAISGERTGEEEHP